MIIILRRFIGTHRTHAFIAIYGWGAIALLNHLVTGQPFWGLLITVWAGMTALMSAFGVLAFSALLLIAILEGNYNAAGRALMNIILCAALYYVLGIITVLLSRK